jgi:hypothetical protein
MAATTASAYSLMAALGRFGVGYVWTGQRVCGSLGSGLNSTRR